MRKLASIKRIKSVSPINNADKIELVQLDDWFCIAKKGEFKVGDKAVYFEIDSFLPVEDRYSFLESSKKEYLGMQGYRIKTMKMRGVISQGLALPLTMFPEIKGNEDDVTDVLKITKYDVADASPSANSLKSGEASGKFPDFIPKTDQNRIQNLTRYYEAYKDELFEETLKLDGSSCTIYKVKAELSFKDKIKQFFGVNVESVHFGVCSRNLEIRRPDSTTAITDSIITRIKSTFTSKKTNSNLKAKQSDFWNIALKYNIEKMLPVGYAIQGEMIGPKIQDNHEKVSENDFYIFDIYDIVNKRYLSSEDRLNFIDKYFNNTVKHVPVVNKAVAIFKECEDINQMLKRVDGESINPGTISEGRVYKMLNNPAITFKCINNKYLVKCEK